MVFLSISCLGRRPLLDGLRELAALGVDHVELTGGCRFDPRAPGALEALKTTVSGLGMTCLLHNYFPPQPEPFVVNLATRDGLDLARLRVLLDQSVALSRWFGQSFLGVHGPFGRELSPETGPDTYFLQRDGDALHWEDFEGNLAWMSAMLPSGFRLAVENAFPSRQHPDYSLLATPDDIFRFAGLAARLGNVGLLLDIGHLAVAGRHLGFALEPFLDALVAKHPGLILELHLSHNDACTDEHLECLPGSFALDFVAANRQAFAHTPMTLEWRELPLERAAHGFKLIRKLIRNA